MAGLQYFVPGAPAGFGLADARAAGLGYAFDQHFAARTIMGAGPSGGPGVVFADDSRVKRVGVWLEEQRWMPVPASERRIHVGCERADPPTPEDLARPRMLAGHPVRLGDGQLWQVPAAVAHAEIDERMVPRQALPNRISVDADGEWRRDQVVDEYAALWDVALRWNDELVAAWRIQQDGADGADASGTAGAAELTFDFGALNDAALLALAVNYRVSKAEIALLGLFADGVPEEILMAVIDWPTLLAWQKKKRADAGAATAAG